MENQSGHSQHGMADQGFRPFTSLLLTTQHHASSSVNTSSIQMPIVPSHPDSGSIWPTDDGYIWRALGWREIPGLGGRIVNYECAQANCRITKSVALSSDGQIVETLLRGSHNHPPPSERWLGGGPAGLGPGSQDYVLPEVSGAEPSMPRSREGDEQLPSSSDSEEDNDDGDVGVEGDIAGIVSAMERHVAAPVGRITVQTRNGNSCRSGRRRSKSNVWKEFTAVFRGGKIHGAECKHCRKCLSGKSTGGTSHLRRHLKICRVRSATGRVQQQRSSPHPDSAVEKNWKLDLDKSLELLTKALVCNLCSFPLTSSTNFRQLYTGICPTYDVISQAAIREKFISIFHNEKLKLEEKIALAPGGVFLTVARWRLESKYFVCVTVHFIDREWNMCRKIIRCSFAGCLEAFEADYYISMFPDSRSCRNLITGDQEAAAEEIVKEVVQNWSLEWKLLGITLPKSLGDAAILGLEKNLTGQHYLTAKYKLLSLPCIIDSLHDLFCYDIKEFVVQTSQEWFEYMTCTSLRRDKYNEILSQLQINRPSFGSQKWHLTFYLLEAALQFNNVLPNPKQIDSRVYPSKPSCTKLKVAEDFCYLVRPIYHAVKVVSCNVTLNSHFHAIWNLKIALIGSYGKENIEQVFNVEEMLMKFDKLWSKWYLWLSLAVVLDPRYKFRFLELCFRQAFGSDAKRYIREVRGKMYELFLQYSCHDDQQSGECLNDSNYDLLFDKHGNVPVHDASQDYIEQSAHDELGELTGYLEAALIPQNDPFDILKWWKDNASMYPTLARLARDILVIPGSAVSPESAFDETDEMVSLFNRKMSPEVVEALICTQDWIKSSEISDENGGNRNMHT